METEAKLKLREDMQKMLRQLEAELYVEAPLQMLKPVVIERLKELVSSNRRDFKIGVSSGVTRPMVYQLRRSQLCTCISHNQYELTDRAYEVLQVLPPEQVGQSVEVPASDCEHDFGNEYESLHCFKCGVSLF